MAGSYCRYCARRCFVLRQVVVGGVVIWQGHMATCSAGAAHDRSVLGADHSSARNPVTATDDVTAGLS